MSKFVYVDENYVEELFKEFMKTLDKTDFRVIVDYYTKQILRQLQEDSL